MKAFIIKKMCPARPDICPSMKICPNHALYYVEDKSEKMKGRIEVDMDKCDGCGKCVDACCGKCIEMR